MSLIAYKKDAATSSGDLKHVEEIQIEHFVEEKVDTLLPPQAEYCPPDGGLQAWLTVLGAWLVLFGTYGYLYAFGVFQDYYTRVYLTNKTPSEIGWIGSIQFMLPQLLGLVSGKLFDKGYFHALEIGGSLLFAISLFMLSLAKPFQYYQIFLSQGVGMGIGLGALFIPAASITTHHFKRRRALAAGITLSGSAAGAIVFPIMLNKFLEHHSFGQSVRNSGFVVLGCLVIGNALMRTRAPPTPKTPPNIKEFFGEKTFLIASLSAIIVGFGLTFPVVYLQLYAVDHNIDNNLAFYTLAIMNASSVIGRLVCNFLADIIGPFNLLLPSTLGSGISILLMMTIGSNARRLIAVTIIYGFFSGAYLSLAVAAYANLSKRPTDIGAKTGIIVAISSFGFLSAAPVAGSVLTPDLHWNNAIIFSGVFTIVAGCLHFIEIPLVMKEKGTWKV